ncbi:hypothetical protein KWG64_12230 [Rahnella sp. PD12R]|uniref:hypothetical protein n=1 Tax=Rahnella sp. PD12R TaxID=2855688 RepID=UPI001C464DB3|nr:hypothetical protein [Rahnella sp. PD12R]MBV6818709.1 hypothetical protein [Rahnella sp. PD12R]
MSKSDSDFINVNQSYELKDWLTRNEFASSDDNVEKLKDIILKKLKDNDSAKNARWSELDAALKNHPSWFSGLDPVKHQK